MLEPMKTVGALHTGPDFESGHFLGTCFAFQDRTSFLTAAHCVKSVEEQPLFVFGAFAGPDLRWVDSVITHDDADLAIVSCPNVNHDMVEPFTEIEATRWGDEFCAFGMPVDTQSFGAPHWGEAVTSYGPTPRFFRGHFQRSMTCHFSHLGYKYYAQEMSIGAPAGMSGGPVFSSRDGNVLLGVVTENRENSTQLHTITEESTEQGTLVERVHAVVNYGVCLTLYEHREWLEEKVQEILQ